MTASLVPEPQVAAYGFATPEFAEIHDWITREVHLLDDGHFDEWYALLDPALKYRMPVRLSLMPKDGFGFRDDMDYYMDDYKSIKLRLDRLKTEMAWAEQPGSRTRHLITNPLVEAAGEGAFRVRAQFLVTRARADQDADIFSGVREDLLVRVGSVLRLRERRILLDQTVLKSFNLSIMF